MGGKLGYIARYLSKLSKKEILWLATHACKHNHSYLEHMACYFKEMPQEMKPKPEIIGFLDIEASNLSADFGFVFSWAIKDLDGEIHGRVLTKKEIQSPSLDKKLLREFVKQVKKYDKVVVHYGAPGRFDIPFLRTRCLYHKLDFPLYREILVEDTYTMAKQRLKLSRNRLENIAVFFNIPCKEHKMNPSMWQKALMGNTRALNYIWRHNKEDVITLELVWKKLSKYAPRRRLSI